RVLEEADDALDRLFHAEEVGEGREGPDRPVHVDATQPRILAGVDGLRLADRRHHALRRTGIRHRIVAAELKVVAERELHLLATLEVGGVDLEQARLGAHGVLLSPARHRTGAGTRPRSLSALATRRPLARARDDSDVRTRWCAGEMLRTHAREIDETLCR